MKAIEVGATAPDFSLTHKVGQDPVTLSGTLEKGPAVLLFFPLAFSGVCTDEMCQVADNFGPWEGVGAQVLGLSTDSPATLAKFTEETKVQFPLLSDFNRDVMTAYGVRNDDFYGMKGVAFRSAFVVGQDGKIAYAWVSEDASVIPPFGEVVEAVASLG